MYIIPQISGLSASPAKPSPTPETPHDLRSSDRRALRRLGLRLIRMNATTAVLIGAVVKRRNVL